MGNVLNLTGGTYYPDGDKIKFNKTTPETNKNIKTNEKNYKDIAGAINLKNKKNISYNPTEMAQEIENITTLEEGTADGTATEGDILNTKTAYVNGKKITGKIVKETKTIIPTKTTQYANPSLGNVLSSVTVSPIPERYQDVSGVTATKGAVLQGNKFVDAKGALTEGSIPKQTSVSTTLNAGSSKTLPAGYYASTSTITAKDLASQTQPVPNTTPISSDTVLTGNSGWANGKQITGTMPNQGAKTSEIQPNGSYTIPAGYHNGSGKITANAPGTATADKILNGEKAWVGKSQITGSMPNVGKEDAIINPTQTHTISEGYHNGTGVINVSTPGNAEAGNVLTGKTAWANNKQITGSMTNNGAIDTTISVASPIYTVPTGYHNGSGKVKIILEEKPITPTKLAQNITPTSGKVLSKVTINPIPKEYQDVTGVTAEANNVLIGKKYVNTQGQLITGTMPNQGAKTSEIQPNGSYTIPAGYHNGSGKITANAPGTATADKILNGEKAWVGKSQITGSMPNNGAVAPAALKAGASYIIPVGYHNGSGKIITENLASQTPGTATAGDIAEGATAYVNGNPVTGIMEDATKIKFGTPRPKLIDMWGVETGVGDTKWWSTLKEATIKSTPEERQAMLGRTKRVSLSSPVLGSNQVLMRCVGYDLDGSKTLTFAAVSALAEPTSFGSDAVWIGSTARAKCQEFYNACSAKNAILTVNKGTCPDISTDSNRNDTPVYNDETVFLMSERELGLDSWSPISTANSTPDRAECTKGFNASYQYFTDNSKRVFYLGNTNGDPTDSNAKLWERSRFYNSTPSLCAIGGRGDAGTGVYIESIGFLPAFAVGQA